MTTVPEPSIFTKIINREIPTEIIYEDEYSIVIPDKFPTMQNQLLVISKRQVPYINELPENEYLSLMSTVRKTMEALDKALFTVRTCVVIEGFAVPHVHVRLYPCMTETLDLKSCTEKSAAELTKLANLIRAVL